MEIFWTILIILVILLIMSIIGLVVVENRAKRPKKKKKTMTLQQQIREAKSFAKTREPSKTFTRYEPSPMDIAMAKYKAKERGYKQKLEYKEEWKRKRDRGEHHV